MERICHWTREGLIKPLGEKNPGTGRHRRYDENTLAEVAVLNALAGLGMQIASLRSVLPVATELIEKWRKKYKDHGDLIFLEIANLNGAPIVRECFAKQLLQTEHAEASLLINITSILQRIEIGNAAPSAFEREVAAFASLRREVAEIGGLRRDGTAFAGLDRGGIIAAIERAIESRQIDFYLQPVVTLPQRKVRYYEALSRFKADNGELVAAGDFLPYAAAGALMPKLDHLSALRCVQVVRRLLLKNRDIGLFCNLSGATLTDVGFPKFLEFMEANRAIAPSLVFEFTQSAVRAMGPIEHESLAALAERGFRFSIDNLTDLRVDARELNERGFRFVKAPAVLCSIGLALPRPTSIPPTSPTCSGRYGIDLIAERIESENTVVDLLDYDVRFGQGFLFSPPRPIWADALENISSNSREDISIDADQNSAGDALKDLVKKRA